MQAYMRSWSKSFIGTRSFVLMMLLVVFCGCASHVKVPPAPAAPEPPAALLPGVERFADGTDGFVIREASELDEDSRLDFENAVVLLGDRDYEPAVALLEAVIARSPGVSAPYINLAIAYRQLGQSEQAAACLNTALLLVPGHPVACNEYGLLHREAGRFAEARAMYEQGIERFPEYSPLHRNLGILCDLYLDDPVCALAHYEIYSSARPADNQVNAWIADLRNRMGGR